MTLTRRIRDQGLQPERTSLSWHRTAFSSLALTLVIARACFCHGSQLLIGLSCASVALSVALVMVSYRRQQTLVCNTDLCTLPSALAKSLISGSLCLNALVITLNSILSLY
ncbi:MULTISPECIES: DUF202 domain-containing protein [Edwardsiella]|uniref:DUF202 domain-containing protein n=1 Tax=Edwardsiella anguillarum TaxID=1821960 RepID=A0ABY8SGA5_9GAMM|nr:DUF202 domain-containing protein [Edwardsiella anguillarum]UBU94873.1 DUF202 domain-containing protein [Edwardsiella sp. LADL05-105]GAJ67901.1 putative membrane protein [Edwardsiella piscicida]KAB0587225.1 DUF202 domain-containing protein [Edwardsiella anguillarum]RFS99767.1 DUF202 domain-containing protein [Edwardsiella anguillarum]UOU80284.1 DUF202 domain-containing protein [Edwardsiella anguillarum]